MTEFSQQVINIINIIPPGKVASYGQIATMAGNPRASRQVSRLLHSSSGKYNLPWHRVINSSGQISLTGDGGLIQRSMLEAEGIEFGISGKIDMKKYLFHG